MLRLCTLLAGCFTVVLALGPTAAEVHLAIAPAKKQADATLQVGFGEADITPKLDGGPVYMAGFGQNRRATKVHDPLMARAIVLQSGKEKIALVSVDVVGLGHSQVTAARKRLPGFTYVLVSSTHNHEGPDTLGIWGESPFKSGIDKQYMKRLEDGIVAAAEAADKSKQAALAKVGTAKAPELLHDGREPYIKHDELVALIFSSPAPANATAPLGILVQWNCHPETLGSKNTEISADFVGATVEHLRKKHGCPVVYLTGTVGGLMTSLNVEVKDAKGQALKDGTFEKTIRYGQLLGELADKALANSKAVELTPLEARSRTVYVPLANKSFVAGWQLGVIDREAFSWKDDPYKAELLKERKLEPKQMAAMQTEVGYLRLGELEIAAIPGEIYPELVLDKVQDPADPGADFPDAPIEPAIYKQLKGPYRMMIGLANDEIGYIIPKRQWDEVPPFCYGRKQAQYGERNSCGPETAPILCRAFQELVQAKKETGPGAGK
jgi:hypothetical protein